MNIRVKSPAGRVAKAVRSQSLTARRSPRSDNLQSMHGGSGVEVANAMEPITDQVQAMGGFGPSISTPSRVLIDQRSRFNPMRQATPELVSTYLDSFDAGYLGGLARLMHAVEDRDLLVKGVVAKRKKAVGRYGWEIITKPGADEAQARDQAEALRFFFDNLEATDVLNSDQSGGLGVLLRQMMDAVGKRFAVHEIVWRPVLSGENAGRITAQFRFCPLWWFENLLGHLRYLPDAGRSEGVEMEPNGWMVTVGDGLMVSTVIGWMFKKLSLSDLLVFSERFGVPGILGKTDGAKDSPEWSAMEEAVRSLANDWSAVCSRSSEITLIEAAKGSGQLPMQIVIDYIDRRIASLWRGGDLSTISQTGSATGSNPQQEDTSLLEEDDISLCEETLNLRIVPYVLRYAFGPGIDQLAYLRLGRPPKASVDAAVKRITCATANGLPVGVGAARELLNLPAPVEDEALLKPPTPAPSAPTDMVNERLSPSDLAQARLKIWEAEAARIDALPASKRAAARRALKREIAAYQERG